MGLFQDLFFVNGLPGSVRRLLSISDDIDSSSSFSQPAVSHSELDAFLFGKRTSFKSSLFGNEEEMDPVAAAPRDNSAGGDPQDGDNCRDCSKPKHISTCSIKQAMDTKAEEGRMAKELKLWYRQLGLFQSGVVLGIVGSVVWQIRAYVLRPRLKNRWGEEAEDWEGGEERMKI